MKTKSLEDDDIIAKYIFRLKDIKENGKPRPSSLKPKSGEQLSLSEVTKLNHNEICEHGHKHVDNNGRIHIGYIKFNHKSLINLELITTYDNNPIRHVSVAFPENVRELTKALADEVIEIDKTATRKYFAPCV